MMSSLMLSAHNCIPLPHPPAAIAPSMPHTSQTLSQLLTLLPFTQEPFSHPAVMLPLLLGEFSTCLGCWFVTLSFVPSLEQRCTADLAFAHYFETSQAFLCSFNSLSSSSWIGSELSVINYIYYRGNCANTVSTGTMTYTVCQTAAFPLQGLRLPFLLPQLAFGYES